jgi:hypothetical protein
MYVWNFQLSRKVFVTLSVWRILKAWFPSLSNAIKYLPSGFGMRHKYGEIFIILRSPGIDSKESIPPAYAAWRAGTKTICPHGP